MPSTQSQEEVRLGKKDESAVSSPPWMIGHLAPGSAAGVSEGARDEGAERGFTVAPEEGFSDDSVVVKPVKLIDAGDGHATEAVGCGNDEVVTERADAATVVRVERSARRAGYEGADAEAEGTAFVRAEGDREGKDLSWTAE